MAQHQVGDHIGSNTGTKKMPMNKGKKIAIALVAIILSITLGAAIAGGMWVHKLNSSLGFDSKEDADALSKQLNEPASNEDPFYMLLLGSDAREYSNDARSDVMILARVDATEGTLHLISIPRDTMVEIEGHGVQKVNAAYSFGGPSEAVQVVSEFAGVPISHYAEIHFDEFIELIESSN